MRLEAFVVLSVVLASVVASPNDTTRDGGYVNYKKKYYGELYRKAERSESELARRSEEYAGEALSGVYTECFAQISFSCLQKKVLSFINRMNRMDKFSLIGNYVSVVRTKNDYEPEPEFQARLLSAEKESSLDQLMEAVIDRFFNNHIIRFKIPNSFAVLKNPENRSYQEDSTNLDFRFPYADESESRKKGGGGGGGGGGKMGKKMMMMMMMGLKTKLMMMGPMLMGMAGMMAMKSMMASMIALTVSKMMLLQKFMGMKKGGGGGGGGGWDMGGGGGGGGPWASGGGGGGGGGPWASGGGGGGGGGWASGGGGGGGGGWDRRNFQDRWDASSLAYRAYSTVENLF